jgi:prepilin-type N-terminal cleavage/methylation domain-containing protein
LEKNISAAISPIASESSASLNDRDGFTLVELLIIIVVLGIMSAVVVYALSGISAKSAQAACQQDGQTVTSAIIDFNNENPGGLFASQAAIAPASAENLLLGTQYGGPYISSWPNNLPHYAYSVSSSGALLVATSPSDAVTPTSPFVTYSGPSSCPSTVN